MRQPQKYRKSVFAATDTVLVAMLEEEATAAEGTMLPSLSWRSRSAIVWRSFSNLAPYMSAAMASQFATSSLETPSTISLTRDLVNSGASNGDSPTPEDGLATVSAVDVAKVGGAGCSYVGKVASLHGSCSSHGSCCCNSGSTDGLGLPSFGQRGRPLARHEDWCITPESKNLRN